MIPERIGVTVDSTVQGEDVAMSIDQSALAHIMNVLTNLYADSELAVIREYSTNALDSHIEAGQTRPIEVTTPTPLRPLLTIRDYGVGLDADDIRDIYSRYGASTKRSSNDAVGMLGLGCKAALAYVDQFTLAGIKDGQRMLVSIARDENGAGTMTVLEAGPTDEPDGVEIGIPTDDERSLERKALDFFSYWQPGLVLLNGEEPPQLSGYAVGDNYLVADRDNSFAASGRHDGRPLTIVMGNVSYPCPDDFEHPGVDSLPRDKRLVVTVPIGAVHFTPSREGLQDSERTQKAIADALEGFQKEVAAVVHDAITGAPDRPSAARALIEARAAFGKANVPDLQWKGEDIPTVLSAEDLDPVVVEDGKREYAASLYAANMVHGYLRSTSRRWPAGQITLDTAGENPWVLGYMNAKWSSTQNRKLRRYLEFHNLRNDTEDKATIFITDSAAVPRPEWIDGVVIAVNWEDVKAWKDPVKVSEGGSGAVKYAGTYPVITEGRYWHAKFEADELPTSGRKLYYVIGDKRSEIARAVAGLLPEDAYVVCLVFARVDKFKRLFPHARNGLDAVKRGAQGWYKSLSDESRLAITLGPELTYRAAGPMALPANKVDDPELSTLCRAYRLWESGTLKERYKVRAAFISRPDDEEMIDYEAVLQRYPLIAEEQDSIIETHSDHALLYVNAVHGPTKEETNASVPPR